MLAHMKVAQEWVTNGGDRRGEAKGSRMYYKGETIYSYGPHFAIARFVQNPRGVTAVLVNPGKYSNSTSAHQRYVRQALDGFGYPTFHVDPLWPDRAFAAYLVRLTELKNKIAMARGRKGDYIRAAQYVHEEMLRYNEFFRCGWSIERDTHFEATLARHYIEHGTDN